MVFLPSVHSGPDSIRSSFCGPINLESGTFAMSVDEPEGGPMVVRVTGDVDSSAVAVFGECVGQATTSGRALVVDLLDVEDIDSAGISVLVGAATKLFAHGCSAVVACCDAMRERLEQVLVGVDFRDTVADAILEAVHARRTPPSATA